MTANIQKLREAVASWPEEDQDELIEVARDIEARRSGAYCATDEEIAGIDRGLKDAEEGRFATDEEMQALLARYRQA